MRLVTFISPSFAITAATLSAKAVEMNSDDDDDDGGGGGDDYDDDDDGCDNDEASCAREETYSRKRTLRPFFRNFFNILRNSNF